MLNNFFWSYEGKVCCYLAKLIVWLNILKKWKLITYCYQFWLVKRQKRMKINPCILILYSN